jgi:hypothetical protein
MGPHHYWRHEHLLSAGRHGSNFTDDGGIYTRRKYSTPHCPQRHTSQAPAGTGTFGPRVIETRVCVHRANSYERLSCNATTPQVYAYQLCVFYKVHILIMPIQETKYLHWRFGLVRFLFIYLFTYFKQLQHLERFFNTFNTINPLKTKRICFI